MNTQVQRTPATPTLKRAATPRQVHLAQERNALELNLPRKLGFYATLALTFLKASSMHEIFAASTGIMVPWIPILMPLALGGMILSGGLSRSIRHLPAKLWILFALILVIGLPFGFWPGGSARRLFDYIRVDYLFFLLLGGTIVTWKECRMVLVWTATAMAIPVFFAIRGGATTGDRMSLRFFEGGSIADPNYLAAHLLLLLPFVSFSFGVKDRGKLAQLALTGVFFGAVYAILRTGSRGALVGMGGALLLFVFRSRPIQAIAILLCLCIAVPVAIAVLPSATLNRLMSFTPTRESSLEAIQSKESRRYLFWKSVEFTLKYPVFGVGIGQFATAEGFASRESGQRGNWHETHNSYTQISSEAGIPALLLFLAAVGSTFTVFLRVARTGKTRGDVEVSRAGKFMILSMVGFSIAAFFLSIGYSCYFPLLSGIALAMLNTERMEQPPAGIQIPINRNLARPGLPGRATR